jgi:hypothetical protein
MKSTRLPKVPSKLSDTTGQLVVRYPSSFSGSGQYALTQNGALAKTSPMPSSIPD